MGSLMTKTLQLLQLRQLTEVSLETGISVYWLLKFRSGLIKNPSVNTVQHLYEHLTNTKLIEA